MNTVRPIAVAALAIAVAVGLVTGCTSDDEAAPVDPPPSIDTESTVMPSTNSSKSSKSSTSSSSSSSSTSTSGTSSRSTVVRTDGGSLEVSGDGAELEVIDVTTEDGWEVTVERPDPRRLEVSFTQEGSRTDITVVLTDSGIQSSTRSVSTG